MLTINPFEDKKNRCTKRFKNQFKLPLVPNKQIFVMEEGVGYKIEEIVLDEKTQQIQLCK